MPHRHTAAGQTEIGWAVWWLDVMLFCIIAAMLTARLVCFRSIARLLISDPSQAVMLGAIPMAISTITNGVVGFFLPRQGRGWMRQGMASWGAAGQPVLARLRHVPRHRPDHAHDLAIHRAGHARGALNLGLFWYGLVWRLTSPHLRFCVCLACAASRFGASATDAAYILFWANMPLVLGCLVVIPICMANVKQPALPSIMLWMLPTVPATVAANTAGVIGAHLGEGMGDSARLLLLAGGWWLRPLTVGCSHWPACGCVRLASKFLLGTG